MNKISIVISGPLYKEFDLFYCCKLYRTIFKQCEIILSTNDKILFDRYKDTKSFDNSILCSNLGELPSLKFPTKDVPELNNNVNRMTYCSIEGIKAANNSLVLKIRTDQVLFNSNIFTLWKQIENTVNHHTKAKSKIITSSIFTINPRYSERMPYHISDMLQFGYKEDLLKYYSAPEYPFLYSVWYENHKHKADSNKNEKMFRSKYAVEQWLALHYIFGSEDKFPIKFHNDFSNKIIEDFENTFIDYFVIAHPDDIGLRASKFINAASYYNTQCYSTYESLQLLEKKYALGNQLSKHYQPKGINKKYYKYLSVILNLGLIQFLIKAMPLKFKDLLKRLIY